MSLLFMAAFDLVNHEILFKVGERVRGWRSEIGLVYYQFVEGRGLGSHTAVCGRKWEWSGRARDHYVSKISDRKYRSGKDR